jgi:hypothetical protein
MSVTHDVSVSARRQKMQCFSGPYYQKSLIETDLQLRIMSTEKGDDLVIFHE